MKTVLLKIAAAAAGITLALCMAAASVFWYASRPKPPKPWNASAIKAEYDRVTTEGDEGTIVFFYTLENTTPFDYRVTSQSQITMTAKLEEENSLTPFLNSEGIEYPIVVPAKKRMRFKIHLKGYTYAVREKDDGTAEERKRYRINLEKYITDKFENLDGFDLLDEENRYEIIFPAGWKHPKS